jgi:dipeptidyl aminopeptidase/acylaminoacyl peptidase
LAADPKDDSQAAPTAAPSAPTTTRRRGAAIDDLTRIQTAGDPQMAPDGARVAFTVRTMDADKNRYDTHVFVVGTGPDGGHVVRQVTRGPESSEGSPRWSPDGASLAFTSGREGKKEQLFLLPLAHGGEAERLTDLPAGALGGYQWSPDGTRIAFRSRPTDEEWREEAVEERKGKKRSTPVREITRLHYREEGTGFVPRARWRLHVLDLSTRAVRPVTPDDTPSDDGAFCWSPDGTRLAVVRNTAADSDYTPNAEEIFVFPADGSGDAVRLDAPLGPKGVLAWSPDGVHVAYLGHARPAEVWGVTNTHLWAVPADGSAGAGARDLLDGWDVTCGNVLIGDVAGGGESGPFWAPDSRSLLIQISDRGAADVWRVSLDGARQQLTEGRHAVLGFTPDAKRENLALLVGTPADAGDLYVLPAGAAFFRRLTRLNQSLFDEMDLPTPVAFEATAPDGKPVPCFACLPPDYADDPRPRPTILYIHGGPHLMYGHALFHEYQALAAAGYVVLFPNPRGSKGYGEEWTGAIRGDWGAPAQADCLACVDHAVAQGWADPARFGVAGGSYGGYLTGWIIGHSDRFAAAVAERGVFNLVSMAGTCDFVWRDDRTYFDSNATDDTEAYRRNSPLTYADRVTCPTLIIHSEGDLRCPIEQAEQYFAALKRRGLDAPEVTFLRYGPESNHNLSRSGPPDLRLDRQRRIHAFFDKHLKGAAA